MSDPVHGSPDSSPEGDEEGGRRHLKLIGRASWNLVDQVLSALTNMVLAVLVAKAAGAAAFDAFSVAFLLFATMIGIERALVAQPLGIRHSGDTGQVRRRTVSRAMGLVVGITVPAALAMLGIGTAIGGRVGSTLIATSVVLPFLIMQDACRHAFFARSEARRAAFNDALWAVVQFSVMGLLIADGSATAPTLVLVWGGSAAVCVVVGLIQLRAVPNPLATLSWIREHKDLVPYFLGEYMLTTGAFNGGYLTVGAIIGDQAVGSIRAAQVLLGPLQIVAGAGMSFGLPELSRRAESLSNTARRKIALLTTTIMAALSLIYAAMLYAVPDALGEFIFEEKWLGSREVLLPLALAMILSTSALGPSMVVYALGQARKSFRLMTIEAPLVFSLMIGGTFLFGVVGAAWGQFLDQLIVLGLWYGTLLGVLAEQEALKRRAAAETGPPQPPAGPPPGGPPPGGPSSGGAPSGGPVSGAQPGRPHPQSPYADSPYADSPYAQPPGSPSQPPPYPAPTRS